MNAVALPFLAIVALSCLWLAAHRKRRRRTAEAVADSLGQDLP